MSCWKSRNLLGRDITKPLEVPLSMPLRVPFSLPLQVSLQMKVSLHMILQVTLKSGTDTSVLPRGGFRDHEAMKRNR